MVFVLPTEIGALWSLLHERAVGAHCCQAYKVPAHTTSYSSIFIDWPHWPCEARHEYRAGHKGKPIIQSEILSLKKSIRRKSRCYRLLSIMLALFSTYKSLGSRGPLIPSRLPASYVRLAVYRPVCTPLLDSRPSLTLP